MSVLERLKIVNPIIYSRSYLFDHFRSQIAPIFCVFGPFYTQARRVQHDLKH